MRRKIVTLIMIVICFILQSTVFQTLSIGSISPNLLLILTVSIGFLCGKKPGLWTGFLCGLLSDLFFGELLGFYALIYMCVGYLAGLGYNVFYEEEMKVSLVMVAGADLFYGGLTYGMQFLMRGRLQFFYYLKRIIIPEMLYTVLITVLLYRIIYGIHRHLKELEMKERDSVWLRR